MAHRRHSGPRGYRHRRGSNGHLSIRILELKRDLLLSAFDRYFLASLSAIDGTTEILQRFLLLGMSPPAREVNANQWASFWRNSDTIRFSGIVERPSVLT